MVNIEAIWRVNGIDRLVVITGYLGTLNNNDYVSIEGSCSGIPLNELRVPGEPFVGFWVDSHGRINTTE